MLLQELMICKHALLTDNIFGRYKLGTFLTKQFTLLNLVASFAVLRMIALLRHRWNVHIRSCLQLAV